MLELDGFYCDNNALTFVSIFTSLTSHAVPIYFQNNKTYHLSHFPCMLSDSQNRFKIKNRILKKSNEAKKCL